MKKMLITSFSWLIIFLGLVSLVTPVPGAFIYLAFGITLLIYSSPKARLCIQWLRTRFLWMNKVFNFLEKKVGYRIKFVGDTLKKTQPLAECIGTKISHKEYVKKKLAQETEIEKTV